MSSRTQVRRRRAQWHTCAVPVLLVNHQPGACVQIVLCTTSPAGDPNTNWAWFENQKKIEANLRLRFSFGAADDLDGLNEHHGAYSETRSATVCSMPLGKFRRDHLGVCCQSVTPCRLPKHRFRYQRELTAGGRSWGRRSSRRATRSASAQTSGTAMRRTSASPKSWVRL